MDTVTVGYYEGRNQARVPVDKGTIKAALGELPQTVRVEAMEGFIVLTHPAEQAWAYRD